MDITNEQIAARNRLMLARPGSIGSLRLEHRILMGSMHLGIEGDAAKLEQLIAFYVERVRGGAALIITGGVAVLPEGGGDHMLDLGVDEHRRQLKQVAEAVHHAGGKIALQLFHSGRYARSSETGLPPVAPSAVFCRLTKETPLTMTLADIRRTEEAFIAGAEIACSHGFDAVEIMASEGYLLNEFLSPLTNQREDEYGNDLNGRMKLSLDIVLGMRKRLGSTFPVIFRMSGDDCMKGSTTRAETLEFAACLERAGADALNIGIGWHESTIPTVAAIVPPAAFAHIAADVRSKVRIPVIAANRVHTPEAAEELFIRQDADFIAPARPWLADAAFALKAIKGDRVGMNLCISCNQACLDHTLGHPPLPVGCLVNPRTGYELAWNQSAEAAVKLRVAIIGGGVAGLAAAFTAAQRGHQVTLYEAASELGGQFRFAARIPGKGHFLETLRYYEEMLARLKVTVKVSCIPANESLLAYDKVIAATGVKPFIPDSIKGVELPHVCNYMEVLSGHKPLGNHIVIVGGGGIGCDIAHYIGEKLNCTAQTKVFFNDFGMAAQKIHHSSVTLVSRSERIGKGIGPTTRWVLLAELNRLGVQVMKGFSCVEITDQGVYIEQNGMRQFLKADQVVLCTGQSPQTAWLDSLQTNVKAIPVGGVQDAVELNAVKAIRQAYELARSL